MLPTNRQKAKLELAEVKILRIAMRVKTMNRARNEHVRQT